MEFIEALRIVFDLAEGNALSNSEADTAELQDQRTDQQRALDLIERVLRDGIMGPFVG